MKSTIAFFIVALLFTSCSRRSTSSDGRVVGFGSFTSPDGTKQLNVTRREKSLVDFDVLDSAQGKKLVSDYIGSDAMRWFLYWETPSRLWGYGSDIGYFKLFEFKSDGTVEEISIDKTIRVPKAVWENIPFSLKQERKLEQLVAPKL